MKSSLEYRWLIFTDKHVWLRYLLDLVVLCLFVASLLTVLLPIHLVTATLATFRIAFMIANEEGPFAVFNSLRTFVYRRKRGTWLDRGVNCVACLSFWCSWLVSLLIPVANWQDYVLYSLSVSCGCLILHKIIKRMV